MRILITAGPTREPIDPVRFLSNHSSGRLGLALVQAGLAAGHQVTAILGPVAFDLPAQARRVDIQTTRELQDAVLREFPCHDLLIMAAAPADFRPKHVADHKLSREASLTIELEPTEDIVAAAARTRLPAQRIISFSLETDSNVDRAKAKLARKGVDMSVYNPLKTMNSPTIHAVLLYRNGDAEPLEPLDKAAFARLLIERGAALLARPYPE